MHVRIALSLAVVLAAGLLLVGSLGHSGAATAAPPAQGGPPTWVPGPPPGVNTPPANPPGVTLPSAVPSQAAAATNNPRVPTATLTPTATPTNTPTATSTDTPTATPTVTSTATTTATP